MRNPRNVIGLIVLTVLVGVFGNRLWSRGMGLRLGGHPTSLSGPHTTEAQWAAAQVITDIAELLLYAKAPTTEPGAVQVTVVEAGPRLRARVPLTQRSVDLDVDGHEGVWSARTYAPIADGFLRELALLPAEAAPAGPSDPAIARFTARLLDVDAAALERESERVGTLLAANMRRADLHEAAAFVVMGLALRECSGHLEDDRPQLLRMLAHLAIARALRGDAPPTFPGAIAEAYADLLAGRGRDAARALDGLGATAAGSDAAWVRVVRTRMDDDWRRLPAPASHVERLEYYRAKLRSVRTTPVFAEGRGLVVADRGLAPPAADDDASDEIGPGEGADPAYQRIVRRDFLRVDAGIDEDRALHDEIGEIAAVWQATHAKPPQGDPIAALDGRRIGGLTGRGPRPLPWGLWSRFFERHLVAFAVQIDRLYRKGYGDTGAAERIGQRLDTRLGGLELYPAATSFRLRGVASGDADLRQIDRAIRATISRPETLPAHVWAWLEYGQQYEPVAAGMPRAVGWFAKPLPRTASVDLAGRIESSGHALSAAELDALWREAPSDFRVAELVMERRFLQDRTADQVKGLFGPRFDYDLRVRRHVGETLTAPLDRVPLEQGNCALDVEGCFALGRVLVDAGRESEAVVAYERGLADPRVGHVAMSNNAGWLVDYYRRHGKVDRAIAIANQAAEAGSHLGFQTRALLFENLDRLDEAEEDYQRIASGYREPGVAIGFYYRMARIRKLSRYEARLQAALPELFPAGLQPIGPTDARQAPAAAVQVTKDSPLSRKYGVRAGDLIVGFDGWRVENLKQYHAVRRFSNDDRMQLVLWRGARVDVAATADGRLLNTELRSFPIRGWAE